MNDARYQAVLRDVCGGGHEDEPATIAAQRATIAAQAQSMATLRDVIDMHLATITRLCVVARTLSNGATEFHEKLRALEITVASARRAQVEISTRVENLQSRAAWSQALH